MAYSIEDASVLVKLALVAETDLTSISGLPSGWTVQTSFSDSTTGIQGIVACGALPATPSVTAYVLALGFNPDIYLNWNGPSWHFLLDLPPDIAGSATVEAQSFRSGLDPVLAALCSNSAHHKSNAGALQDAFGYHIGSYYQTRSILSSFETARRQSMRWDAISPAMHSALQPVTSRGESLIKAVSRLDIRTPVNPLDVKAASDAAESYEAARSTARAAIAKIVSESGSTSVPSLQVEYGSLFCYQRIRTAVWNALANVGLAPVYVTAHSFGALFAQIAAYDLRPGRANPASPLGSMDIYLSSAPSVGNAAFATALSQAVNDCYRPLYEDDEFPSEPTAAEGYSPAGTMKPVVSSTADNYEAPWWEGSATNYEELLSLQATNLATGRVVAAFGGRDLHLFGRDPHHEIRHRVLANFGSSEAVWQPEKNLGPMAPGAVPTVSSVGKDSLVLAAPGARHAGAVRLWKNGSWSAWKHFPGSFLQIAAASGDGLRFHIVAQKQDGTLQYFEMDSESNITSASAVALPPGGLGELRLALHEPGVVASSVSADGGLIQTTFDGSSWSDWRAMEVSAAPADLSGVPAEEKLLTRPTMLEIPAQCGGGHLALALTDQGRLVIAQQIAGTWTAWSLLKGNRRYAHKLNRTIDTSVEALSRMVLNRGL